MPRIFNSKKEPKVTDPVRFPKVINGYENLFKINWQSTQNKTILDQTKLMKEVINENK